MHAEFVGGDPDTEQMPWFRVSLKYGPSYRPIEDGHVDFHSSQLRRWRAIHSTSVSITYLVGITPRESIRGAWGNRHTIRQRKLGVLER
jgi:hypothetical protein